VSGKAYRHGASGLREAPTCPGLILAATSAATVCRLQRERALPFGADRICLWRLCADAGCRRARACRGDVRAAHASWSSGSRRSRTSGARGRTSPRSKAALPRCLQSQPLEKSPDGADVRAMPAAANAPPQRHRDREDKIVVPTRAMLEQQPAGFRDFALKILQLLPESLGR
jgi:hypothetical protein